MSTLREALSELIDLDNIQRKYIATGVIPDDYNERCLKAYSAARRALAEHDKATNTARERDHLRAINADLLAALKDAFEALSWHGGLNFQNDAGQPVANVILTALHKAEGQA